MQRIPDPTGNLTRDDIAPLAYRQSLFAPFEYAIPLAPYTAEWAVVHEPTTGNAEWLGYAFDATQLHPGNRTVEARDAVNDWPAISATCTADLAAYLTKAAAAGTLIHRTGTNRHELSSTRSDTRAFVFDTDTGEEEIRVETTATGQTSETYGPGDCSAFATPPPDPTTTNTSAFPSPLYPDAVDGWQVRVEANTLCSGSLRVTLSTPTTAAFWQDLDDTWHSQSDAWRALVQIGGDSPMRTESVGVKARLRSGRLRIFANPFPDEWFLNSRQPDVDYSARNTDGSVSLQADLTTSALRPLLINHADLTTAEADTLLTSGSASITLSDQITETLRDDYGTIPPDPTPAELWDNTPTRLLAQQNLTNPMGMDATFVRGKWRSADGRRYRLHLLFTDGTEGPPDDPPAGTTVTLTMARTLDTDPWETEWFQTPDDLPTAPDQTLVMITADVWNDAESEWEAITTLRFYDPEPPYDPLDPPEVIPATETDLVRNTPCSTRPLLYFEQRRDLHLWGFESFTASPPNRYATATIAVDLEATGTPSPACSCGEAPQGSLLIDAEIALDATSGLPTTTITTAEATLNTVTFYAFTTPPATQAVEPLWLWDEIEALIYALLGEASSDTVLIAEPETEHDWCAVVKRDSLVPDYDPANDAVTTLTAEATVPTGGSYLETATLDPGNMAAGETIRFSGLRMTPSEP